jgi:site-specific recombinase XerD
MLTEYSAPTAARSIPHPIPEGIPGVYRLIEVASNERQKAMIALCGLQGLRIAEALATRPSDFDLNEMCLTVRGKGDKTRVIPVSSNSWNILAVPVTRAFVEGDREVVGLRDRFARRVVTRLGEKAGLRRAISSHDLRSTFATEVYNKTQDIRLVQELLGHASVTTTEVYTLVGLDNMRKAIEL